MPLDALRAFYAPAAKRAVIKKNLLAQKISFRRYKQYTEAECDVILRLESDGYSCHSIAVKLKIPKQSVRNIVKRFR